MDLLDKVFELEQDAAAFGFKWTKPEQIMRQIESECLEIQEHLQTPNADQDELQEEIGDLLHAAFSLCVFCKMAPRETLQKTLDKFERRINMVKDLARSEGHADLNGHSFEDLMTFWDRAKILTAIK